MSTSAHEAKAWEVFHHPSDGVLVRIADGGACVAWTSPAGCNDVFKTAHLIAAAPKMKAACAFMLANAFMRKWDGDERAFAMLSEISKLIGDAA